MADHTTGWTRRREEGWERVFGAGMHAHDHDWPGEETLTSISMVYDAFRDAIVDADTPFPYPTFDLQWALTVDGWVKVDPEQDEPAG